MENSYVAGASKSKNGKLSAASLIDRFAELKNARAQWDIHFQEVANYFIPNKSTITIQRTDGDKRNILVLDNVGMQSSEVLAGSLHGILTNVDSKWFDLTTGDVELDDDDFVREWLDKSSKVILNAMNASNFQTEVHEYYLDLVNFGTACMDVQDDNDMDVAFKTHFIKDIFIAENHKGFVDEVYRLIEMDSKQLIQMFGEKVLPDEVKKCYQKGDSKKFEVIHAVYPSLEPKDIQKFVSQYILKDKQQVLQESSFRSLPYVVSRWMKSPGEKYGRSPAMTALPEMKVVNKMTEVTLKGASRVVDPPLQAPDDGFIFPNEGLENGDIVYYRSGSNDRIMPVFNDTRIDLGFEATRERREKVREAFYVNQLQTQNGPQMTATEVMQRTEEQSRILAPILGRQSTEFLTPLIDRVYDLLEKRGKIPKAPAILAGMRITPKYSSLIAKSQRLSEGTAILRSVEAIAPFLQMDPTAVDQINANDAVRMVAKIYGAQAILNKQEAVEQMREARAEQAQAEQQMVQESQEAQNAKNLAPMIKAVK